MKNLAEYIACRFNLFELSSVEFIIRIARNKVILRTLFIVLSKTEKEFTMKKREKASCSFGVKTDG